MAAIVRAGRSLVSLKSVYWRGISTTHNVFNSEEKLEKAKQRVMQLTEDPGNENKLKLYALYKQATVGKCNTSRPGMMDFVGRAKWDSWNNLGDMDTDQAITKYCDLVDSLVGNNSTEQETTGSVAMAMTDREGILVTDENGVRTITLNRPNKKNAITTKMYSDIQDILNSSASDKSVRTVMFTGSGDYYCSGNDLSNFLNIPPEGPEKLAKDSSVLLKHYVDSYIKFPKPLIAAVNGPAVGISVTVLCLFDLVYAADHATFHTPFTQLGQSPEGCSSFMFPRIMGAKANEMLLLGKKLTATEACDSGLVTRVFPQNEFNERVKEIALEIAQLPPNSVLKSKELIRSTFNHMLLDQNEKECELLVERWLSEECMTAIMNFMQRKK